MKFYIPSWNGDFRLESDGEGGTRLVVHDPTPHERKIIGAFLRRVEAKGWTSDPRRVGQESESTVKISASLSKVSAVLIELTRPKKQTLTAVSFSDGKLSVIEGADASSLEEISDAVEEAATTEDPEHPAKAASVRRPTPCCPDCEVGAVAPASEVLRSFLSAEEHETWASERSIVVRCLQHQDVLRPGRREDLALSRQQRAPGGGGARSQADPRAPGAVASQ